MSAATSAVAGPTSRFQTRSTTTAAAPPAGLSAAVRSAATTRSAVSFGIQAMGDWTNAHGSNTWLLGGNVNITDVRWFSTLTGRIGFVQTASFLLYGKGSGAWAGDQHQITTRPDRRCGRQPYARRLDRRRRSRMAVRAELVGLIEYDYLGFGSSTFAFAPCRRRLLLPDQRQAEHQHGPGRGELPLRPAARRGRAALLSASFIAHEKSLRAFSPGLFVCRCSRSGSRAAHVAPLTALRVLCSDAIYHCYIASRIANGGEGARFSGPAARRLCDCPRSIASEATRSDSTSWLCRRSSSRSRRLGLARRDRRQARSGLCRRGQRRPKQQERPALDKRSVTRYILDANASIALLNDHASKLRGGRGRSDHRSRCLCERAS